MLYSLLFVGKAVSFGLESLSGIRKLKDREASFIGVMPILPSKATFGSVVLRV